MSENRASARCLIASVFMFFGALACFMAGYFILTSNAEKLVPVGALPFLIGGLCYLWFAVRLWGGARQPVASLSEFAKGNFFLAFSIYLFFYHYGEYVGHFGDSEGLVKVVNVLVMLIAAPLIFIEAIARLRGVRKAKQMAAAGEDK